VKILKFGYASWLPETNMMRKFTEELANGRLMGTKCKKCKTKYMPPRIQCRCGSTDMEWYEAPKKGKLLAYTIIMYPPESMQKYAPYIVAVAELEDGTRLLSHIVGVTPKTLKVGMPIEVSISKVSEDRITYKFKPST